MISGVDNSGMKWGIHSQKIQGKIGRLVSKVAGARGFYVLLALAALVLLSGANEKWGR